MLLAQRLGERLDDVVFLVHRGIAEFQQYFDELERLLEVES